MLTIFSLISLQLFNQEDFKHIAMKCVFSGIFEEIFFVNTLVLTFCLPCFFLFFLLLTRITSTLNQLVINRCLFAFYLFSKNVSSKLYLEYGFAHAYLQWDMRDCSQMTNWNCSKVKWPRGGIGKIWLADKGGKQISDFMLIDGRGKGSASPPILADVMLNHSILTI